MKATELMIGDWVQGHLPNTIAKVVGIPNETRVAVIGGKTYMELSADDIQPIPLTEKILRRNCIFDHPQGSKYYHLGDDFYLLENIIGSYVICVKYYDGYVYDYKEVIGCEFVHELQHAIRMLNVDKEIIL